MENVTLAFTLTIFAGLSTGIGSAIGFFSRRTNTGFLSAALGFSAGVMLYLSFVEILPKATESLAQAYPGGSSSWLAVGAFFGGILLIALIDRLVPSHENPHEARRVEEMCDDPDAPCGEPTDKKLIRMGLFTALAIAIHNFPEGIATFAATLADPTLGFSTALAIAIHNIPEGIAVSVPIYYATGSRKKAFLYSFVSGVSEPIGALIGYLFMQAFSSDGVFGVIFAGVGGIMVFISLDELLPTAKEYGRGHVAICGLIIGMALMALSLLLLG